MKNQLFWEYFNEEASPFLFKSHRESTFRKIFEFLDRIDRPITILESGCVRNETSFSTDGCSTVLFDKYISLRDKTSVCYTVDIDSNSVKTCKQLVSNRVNVIQSDSVNFFKKFAQNCFETNNSIDFVYLDSFDLDWVNWYPSAIHHLQELCAVAKGIRPDTLVVVDDSPLTVNYVLSKNNLIEGVGPPPVIGGKGRLIAEYAQKIGATIEFSEYQIGFTGLV